MNITIEESRPTSLFGNQLLDDNGAFNYLDDIDVHNVNLVDANEEDCDSATFQCFGTASQTLSSKSGSDNQQSDG